MKKFHTKYSLVPLLFILVFLQIVQTSCDKVEKNFYSSLYYDDDDNDDDSKPETSSLPNEYFFDKCSPPQSPPRGYFPYEASWLLVRFDDPETPIVGIYAYFWIDWFLFEGCSYTSAQSVIFLEHGGLENVVSDGGVFTGLDIKYQSESSYDIFVNPYFHVRNDALIPMIYHVDFFGDGYNGSLDILVNHFHFWSGQWYTFYDAIVSDAKITIGHETHFPKNGKATLERWFDIGGVDPLVADMVKGYWLYAPMHWEDDQGQTVTTLTYYWVSTEEQKEVSIFAQGVLSDIEGVVAIKDIEVDFDYEENRNTNGYLRKYGLTGFLENGESFNYTLTVDKEYVDDFYNPWADLLPDDDRLESHSLASGTMEYNGKTYSGGGIFEWKTSDMNPITNPL